MDYPDLLRIRAWLRTPVIADEWMPLDAILYYQAHRDLYGVQDVTIPGAATIPEPEKAAPMPLSKVHAARGYWYYHCSWAQWGPHADGQDHWNKRFDVGFADLVDFQGRRGKVIIERSTYKAYHVPVFYRSALWVEWYCKGNRAWIESLLLTCFNLGKKTSQGWGKVIRWQIEPILEDWSIWKDGRLMRGIPPEDLSGKPFPVDIRLANYGIRPSYWDRANQMTLAMP